MTIPSDHHIISSGALRRIKSNIVRRERRRYKRRLHAIMKLEAPHVDDVGENGSQSGPNPDGSEIGGHNSSKDVYTDTFVAGLGLFFIVSMHSDQTLGDLLARVVVWTFAFILMIIIKYR